MRSKRTPQANLDEATALIREAAAAGAQYVQTPEMTNIMELSREKLFAAISEEETDICLAAFRDLARELKIHLHIGSLAIKVSPDKAANRAFVIDPRGDDRRALRQDPHVRRRSRRRRELSRIEQFPCRAKAPSWSICHWARFGLTICYDLRFPALYRALAEAGATVLTIPAAFTRQTGEAHWHTLIRARAIENGSFVLAAAQGGTAREWPRDLRPFAGR